MGYRTQGQPQLPLTGLRVEQLQAMGPPSHQEPEQTPLIPAPEDPVQVSTLQTQAPAPAQLILETGNPVHAGIPQVQHPSLNPRPSHWVANVINEGGTFATYSICNLQCHVCARA